MVRGVPRSAALALACALVLGACGSDDPAAEPTASGSPPAPAPTSTLGPADLVEGEVPVGGEPIGIAAGEGSLWVVASEFRSGGEPAVYRIDPSTNEVVAEVGPMIAPDGLATDGTFVFVATENGPSIAAIEIVDDNLILEETPIADEGFITANQVMVLDSGLLWLPILGRGVVLRVRAPVSQVE
jgi:hypothetical protein